MSATEPDTDKHSAFLDVKRDEARRQWREYYWRNRTRLKNKDRLGGVDRRIPLAPAPPPGPVPLFTGETAKIRRRAWARDYYARHRNKYRDKMRVYDAKRSAQKRSIRALTKIVEHFIENPTHAARVAPAYCLHLSAFYGTMS